MRRGRNGPAHRRRRGAPRPARPHFRRARACRGGGGRLRQHGDDPLSRFQRYHAWRASERRAGRGAGRRRGRRRRRQAAPQRASSSPTRPRRASSPPSTARARLGPGLRHRRRRRRRAPAICCGCRQEQIAHAVSIMAVANVPLRATRVGELSKWKGAATAFACRNAVFAVQLARRGNDRAGRALHRPPRRVRAGERRVRARALRPYLTPRVGIKYWPVENSAQRAVWAALKLREAVPAAAIAEIDIATARPIWREIGSEPAKWDPKTRETADHSLALHLRARAGRWRDQRRVVRRRRLISIRRCAR